MRSRVTNRCQKRSNGSCSRIRGIKKGRPRIVTGPSLVQLNQYPTGYLTKRISVYVGIGQCSLETISSSSSDTARTAFMAGMTFDCM